MIDFTGLYTIIEHIYHQQQGWIVIRNGFVAGLAVDLSIIKTNATAANATVLSWIRTDYCVCPKPPCKLLCVRIITANELFSICGNLYFKDKAF